MADEEIIETSEEYVDEEEEKLPFAKAEVVRLMKENLDDDKMIRERVKVEMNKFLGEVLKNVCKQLNEYPYTTIEYEMLKESTLAMDVQKTLKLKDVVEEDTFTNFTTTLDEEEEEE